MNKYQEFMEKRTELKEWINCRDTEEIIYLFGNQTIPKVILVDNQGLIKFIFNEDNETDWNLIDQELEAIFGIK